MNTKPCFCKGIFAKKHLRIPLIFNLFFVSILFVSCNGGQNWEQQSDGGESWGDSNGSWGGAPSYPVFEVSKDNYTGYETYPAKIEGIQDIEIRAKIGGYIQAIFVDEGQFVEKGQTLFKLEANAITQNTKASKEAAKAAEAAVKTAEATVASSKIEVDRLKPLVDKKIISEVQLQTAEANYQSAQARLQTAHAQLNQAQSTYQGNQANENYTKIVSPITGYVGKLNFRIGSLVGPADALALTTVSNTKEVYVYFSMSERAFAKLSKKMPGRSLVEKLSAFPTLKLQTADGTDYSLEGKMDASTGKISPQTGAIQLRARFDNPNQELLSGSNGMIKIPTFYKNHIAIPATASFELQGQPMVYKLIKGDTLIGNPIQILDKVDRYFIVESGLSVGDKVLAQGVSKVYPYTTIKPQMVDIDSIANSFQSVFQ